MLKPPILMENFLPEPMQDEIERVLMGIQFPWHFYPNTNSTDEKTLQGDAAQLVHGFIQNHKVVSPWSQVAQAITQRLGVTNEQIIRAKSNLVGRELSALTHPKHVDDDQAHWVFIYYVNDSDGDTCLYEGDELRHRITPKRGLGVAFDGRWWHASSSPVETPYRCIFNYNLSAQIPEELFQKFSI